jgi:hypothetical protein
MAHALILKEIISEMNTFCPTCDLTGIKFDSCQWIGELHLREKHCMTECDFVLIKCPNTECDSIFQRNFLNRHISMCGVKYSSIPLRHDLQEPMYVKQVSSASNLLQQDEKDSPLIDQRELKEAGMLAAWDKLLGTMTGKSLMGNGHLEVLNRWITKSFNLESVNIILTRLLQTLSTSHVYHIPHDFTWSDFQNLKRLGTRSHPCMSTELEALCDLGKFDMHTQVMIMDDGSFQFTGYCSRQSYSFDYVLYSSFEDVDCHVSDMCDSDNGFDSQQTHSFEELESFVRKKKLRVIMTFYVN